MKVCMKLGLLARAVQTLHVDLRMEHCRFREEVLENGAARSLEEPPESIAPVRVAQISRTGHFLKIIERVRRRQSRTGKRNAVSRRSDAENALRVVPVV